MVIACAAALVRNVAGRYGNDPDDPTWNPRIAGWLIDDARRAFGDAILAGDEPVADNDDAAVAFLKLWALRLAHPDEVPDLVGIYDKAAKWTANGAKAPDMHTVVRAAVHAIAWFAQMCALANGDTANAHERARSLLDRTICAVSEREVWREQ
jgi:hypothetical protein